MGEQLVDRAVRTHTFIIYISVVYGHSLWFPKTISIGVSMITDHHNKYNNNEKV